MDNILQLAIKELKIDVPVLNWTIQNGKVTLLLYGGQVKEYQLDQPGSVQPGETKRQKGKNFTK